MSDKNLMEENVRGYAEFADYAARLLMNPLVGFSRVDRQLLHEWVDSYLAGFEARLARIPNAQAHIAEERFFPEDGLAHLVFDLSMRQP